MPRSTKEILAQAEEFAKRFEDYEPVTDDGLDARSLRDIRHAFVRRAAADRGDQRRCRRRSSRGALVGDDRRDAWHVG